MSSLSSAPMPDASTAHALAKLTDPQCLNLLLVRHGQAGGKGNHPDLAGPVLSDLGEQQANLLAERFANLPLAHLYCSDMARSYQTAAAVARHHPGAPFASVPEVREIAGFQLRHRRPARTRAERERLHRERDNVHRFVSLLRREHTTGQLVAVIAHNGVNGMILAELSGLRYRDCVSLVSSHTGVTMVNIDLLSPLVVLRLMGCTAHLPPDMISYENANSEGAVAGQSVVESWRSLRPAMGLRAAGGIAEDR